ncbi:YtxH domain-containing protein [Patescibacteria group bacterium]|nr:YtxH domain-containing protein [Patescibacteria group bacterium]
MLRKKNKEKSNDSAIDRIVMGAIIGTAIGSVLGISLAPKKGQETRSDLKEVSKLGKETASGFFKLARRLLLGKKTKQEKSPHGMKEIPNEMEVTKKEHVDRD